jgi:hypothetical protein
MLPWLMPLCPPLYQIFSKVSKPADSKTVIHSLYNVSQKVLDPNISAVLTPYTLTKNLNVMSYINQAEKPSKTLIDSGMMGNFIHEEVVWRLRLVRQPQAPLPLLDIKGINIGELCHQVTLNLCIGSHEEKIMLDVVPIGQYQIILGLPWLEAHDPEITWSTGHIHFGSHYCNENCMPHPNDIFAQRQPMVTLNTL